jgi:hypothetical protein
MAWFLFIDESGQDHKESPYEVLAGVAILDADLWDLIKELHDAEIANFGRRYTDGARELKGKAILKKRPLPKHLLPPWFFQMRFLLLQNLFWTTVRAKALTEI